MSARAAVAVALLLACAGCTKKEPRGPGRIVTLDTDVVGLSGLTLDEHGAFWAPGEDGGAVIRIDPETFGVTRYAVRGGAPKTDLEAMAWVDGTRFVLGTETQEKGRLRDVVLDGRLDRDRFVVTSVGHLAYARWNLTAPDNRGIEGICHVDGVLVLATELVERQRGRRWAPLGMFDPKTQTWTAHRVGLTSKTGKLAAIDCRIVDGSIEALAVERHYGVSRLLRFRVPRGPEGRLIEPTVAADLAESISPLPNFEGLVWMEDGSAVLVTDNQYRGAAPDSSRLYFIPASAIQ
ncbi:MAG: esterase-like activity of phytase family protein [Deltaproteobacteria bacterium]|nr:esterase-like activity of phytase family protein [Deltaproteobacteria bacterium]